MSVSSISGYSQQALVQQLAAQQAASSASAATKLAPSSALAGQSPAGGSVQASLSGDVQSILLQAQGGAAAAAAQTTSGPPDADAVAQTGSTGQTGAPQVHHHHRHHHGAELPGQNGGASGSGPAVSLTQAASAYNASAAATGAAALPAT